MKKILGVLIYSLLIIVLIGVAVILFYIPTKGIIYMWKEAGFLHIIADFFFTEEESFFRGFLFMYFLSFVIFYIVYQLIKSDIKKK